MRKIIFLDFDGVITTLKSRWKLDKEKLELLKRIVDETDCLFVISSSWRRGNLEQTKHFITNHRTNKFVGNNPFPFLDRVIGQTCFDDKPYRGDYARTAEIYRWIADNYQPNDLYLVLDDMYMILPQDMFIMTDYEKGLSEEDVERAIEILNKFGK